MFRFVRPDFRQPRYGCLLPWEETTKNINLQSTLYRAKFHPQPEKLRYNLVLPIPAGAISLRSTDGSPLKISGFIRFALNKLGNKSLPVEALALPLLGLKAMLIDNSIMKAFEAKLDWAAERLFFKDSNITIPAIHTRQPIRSKYCSVITQDSDTPNMSLCVFLISTLSQPHMKHSFVFSARHDLKQIR